MQWEQLGAPAVFTIKPTLGKIFNFSLIRIMLIDNIASTLTDGTVTGLSYNNWMGLSALTNGVLSVVTQGGVPRGFPIRQISDLLFSGGEIRDVIALNGNTALIVDFPVPAPVRLDSRMDDSASLVVSDDLSGLIQFRAFAGGTEVDPL